MSVLKQQKRRIEEVTQIMCKEFRESHEFSIQVNVSLTFLNHVSLRTITFETIQSRQIITTYTHNSQESINRVLIPF